MSDTFTERDLKCEFPARESFRDALLSDLLAADKSSAQQDAANDRAEKGLKAPRIVKLSDSELEWVAAAQGEERAADNPFEE